ncbi:SDR family NAD(P)-dependent oxidoreductase [Nocardioides sp. JQ2195]|uniref:SDR family NAD(P)-dependent oxidoreductase n=1 Tax=Nocardioides sp. JQ2195 TaxID=2592334 RepID=UPI00143E3982|nr:SDR family NAD(P)-dependent oxidoreductase [Nocardioides sp. JQ2195]QIX26553.1 SDR family NAD(P)-dependent oxidoreductase [Nocardioides sp. JQ2195]
MTDLAKCFGERTAVVTGAGSGIGEAVARLAASIGMNVVLADLDEDRLESVRAALAGDGRRVLAVPTDVRDPEAVERLAERAHQEFGSVELLVNNAGIESIGRIWEMDPDTWHRVQGINAGGVFHGIRSFVPRMGANPRPTYVVNTASVAAISNGTMNAAYFASKHSVLAMTECLYLEALESFPSMTVSVVCPAAVSTRIFEDAVTDADEDVATGAMLEAMRGHLRHDGMSSDDAARTILQGAADGTFWIMTHPEAFTQIAARRADMLSSMTPPQPYVLRVGQASPARAR